MADDREWLAEYLAQRGNDLDRLRDLITFPPNRPFTAHYGITPHFRCRGTTQQGQSCNAHPILVSYDGWCHWHDPNRRAERALWRRRGPGFWGRVLVKAMHLAEGGAVISSGDGWRGDAVENRFAFEIAARVAAQEQAEAEHGYRLPLRVSLAATAPGLRRVAEALVESPGGLTYGEVARGLGVTVGTVRRQLVRLKAKHPLAHAALMEIRAEQLAERRGRNEARHRARWAERRADHLRRTGREPWEG